jgi:hypothetical protein
VDYTDLPLTECWRGGETEMLCFALDRVRVQFAWKTGRLDAGQLRRQHPPLDDDVGRLDQAHGVR